MTKFKAGEYVKIGNISKTIDFFGEALEMFSMINGIYQIAAVDDYEVRIEGFSFHEDDLIPVPLPCPHSPKEASNSFIDSLLSGDEVFSGSVKGKFMGYAIKVEKNGVEATAIVDAGGYNIPFYNIPFPYRLHRGGIKFFTSPEECPKILWHSVAYTLPISPKGEWETAVFTDEELNNEKHNFHSYKILETWRE